MAGEYINPEVFDGGLDILDALAAGRIDITSQVATTFGNATTTDAFSLGNKTGIAISAPGAAGSGTGQSVTTDAITDGTVTTATSDTATHWALTDTATLYATGPLTASQTVTNGNTFSLDAIEIFIRDATVT
jgi:hypothetical protein